MLCDMYIQGDSIYTQERRICDKTVKTAHASVKKSARGQVDQRKEKDHETGSAFFLPSCIDIETPWLKVTYIKDMTTKDGKGVDNCSQLY